MPSAHHKKLKTSASKAKQPKLIEKTKRESDREVAARHLNPGRVMCLGWCGKEFNSPNKVKVRYCPKCSRKKDDAQRSLSWRAIEITLGGPM